MLQIHIHHERLSHAPKSEFAIQDINMVTDLDEIHDFTGFLKPLLHSKKLIHNFYH